MKDFALGSFNTCKVTAQSACPTVTFDAATGQLNYTANLTITNDGFGTLFDLVADLGTPTPQQFTLVSLAAGASQTFTATFSVTPGPSTPNPPTITLNIAAAPNPGGAKIVTTQQLSASCPKVEFDAALTITKSCETQVVAQNNQVVVQVNVTGTVCNVAPDPSTGDFPESISGIVVTDTPDFPGGAISIGTLKTGECVNYQSSYFPSTVAGTGVPSEQTYEDTVLVQGTGTISGNARSNTATANCPLCPPDAH